MQGSRKTAEQILGKRSRKRRKRAASSASGAKKPLCGDEAAPADNFGQSIREQIQTLRNKCGNLPYVGLRFPQIGKDRISRNFIAEKRKTVEINKGALC